MQTIPSLTRDYFWKTEHWLHSSQLILDLTSHSQGQIKFELIVYHTSYLAAKARLESLVSFVILLYSQKMICPKSEYQLSHH